MIKYPNGKIATPKVEENKPTKKQVSAKLHLSAMNRGMNLENDINLTNDWTINRYLAGWQDIYTHREDMPNEYDILWDDETDDFDFPKDIDRFIAYTGKRLG